ncbi:MAG: hypothetical protein CMJ32_06380 [Phycisphaerae bacterium]|nr:hypothetical protein [Phycisphaerae bacterium]
MWNWLNNLDRRWIFLMMFLAVSIPILIIGVTGLTFPETPTPLAQATFDALDELPSGSKILLSFDYDPASEGELGPMATSFVHQCAQKGHKMYFMTLWPLGPRMIEKNIEKVITSDYPDLQYGVDYVNLGYRAGNEGVIKVIVTDLQQMYLTDVRGVGLKEIPMMDGIRNIQAMDLIVNVSAGYAGTKEWVQYAVSAFPDKLRMVAGCTGVQAPLLYPYIPDQLIGLLGAIKGAAEYESIVNTWVRRDRLETMLGGLGFDQGQIAELVQDPSTMSSMLDEPRFADQFKNTKDRDAVIALAEAPVDPKYLEGQRRMGPQLVAHLLMVGLIILGNIIFFVGRGQGGAA